MYTADTFNSVWSKSIRCYNDSIDQLSQMSDIDFDVCDDGTFIMNRPDAQPSSMSSSSLRQASSIIGVAAPVLEKTASLDPMLAREFINAHWQSRIQDKNFLVREVIGTTANDFYGADYAVRAMLSDRYHRIHNSQIVVMLDDYFKKHNGQPYEIMSCFVDAESLFLKIVFPENKIEVEKGDIVESGLLVKNSEIGTGSFKILPFFHRLVCTNGMVLPEFSENTLSRKHMGIKRHDLDSALDVNQTDLLQTFRDFMSVVDFETGKDQMLRASQITTGDNIIPLLQHFGVPKDDHSRIEDNYRADGLRTLWGVANAVTLAAETSNDYYSATGLEAIGGRMITDPSAERMASLTLLAA